MSDLLSQILAEDDHADQKPQASTLILSFQMRKGVLQALLSRAITAVPTGDAMPVLRCFQFHADSEHLRVIGTDLDKTLIASTTHVSVTQPGTAVFPARKLTEIIKAADAGEDVRIEVKNTTAIIRVGRALWTLQLMGGWDYPPLPVLSDAELVKVDRDQFSLALGCVRYAVSRDPGRANLNVIDIHDGKLTGCDGSRIQQARISDFPLNLRIPIATVDDLIRLMRSSDLDVMQVGQSENKLIFKIGNDVLIMSKLHAAFPDLESTLLRPALENKHLLEVARHELTDAIRRVRINADAESSAIALSLERDKLSVTATDKFGNTAGDTLDCRWRGPDRTIVVNHKHLTDMIGVYDDITCAFKLGEDSRTRRSPLMLRHPVTGSTGVIPQMITDWVST